MPVYRTDNSGNYIQLSDKEIKKFIQDFTNLDNRGYQKLYDNLRNRLRNYQIITGSTSKIRVNELLYRALTRVKNGQEFTAQQMAIFNTTSQSTGTTRRQLESGTLNPSQKRLALEGIVNEFNNLIQKAPTVKKNYSEWLAEIVNIESIADPETGEIIEQRIITRGDIVTPSEVREFLNKEAEAMHLRQQTLYDANKKAYKYNMRNVPSL